MAIGYMIGQERRKQMGKLRRTLALLDAECESLQDELINPAITDKDMLARAIGGNEADWLTQIENIGRILIWWKREKDFIKKQIEALKETIDKMEEREDWLREYTVESMINRNDTHLRFSTITMYVQASPPKVEVQDESIIPSEFQKLIPSHYEINKSAIIEWAKKTGEIVAGCKIVLNKHLVVR